MSFRIPPPGDKTGFDDFFEKVMRSAGAREHQFAWSLFDAASSFRTSQTLNLYVDPVNGSDIRGDGSQAKPYQTIQNATTAIPLICTQPVNINLVPGTYAGEIRFSAFAIAPITIVGPPLTAATVSGLQTGTVASVGTGADPNPRTWTVTGAGWTSGALAGLVFQVTSGTSSGKTYVVVGNTATTIELATTDSNIVGNTFALMTQAATITRASTDLANPYNQTDVTGEGGYTGNRLLYVNVQSTFQDNGLIFKNVKLDFTVNSASSWDNTGELLFDTCYLNEVSAFPTSMGCVGFFNTFINGQLGSSRRGTVELRLNGSVIDAAGISGSAIIFDCFLPETAKLFVGLTNPSVIVVSGGGNHYGIVVALGSRLQMQINGTLCIEGSSSDTAIAFQGPGSTITGFGTLNLSGTFTNGISLTNDGTFDSGGCRAMFATLNIPAGVVGTGILLGSSHNFVRVNAGQIQGCSAYGVNMAASPEAAFNFAEVAHTVTMATNTSGDFTLDGTSGTAHTLAAVHGASNSKFTESTIPTYNIAYSP